IFLPSTTRVCPALLPPAKRATSSASAASTSTTLPLPSSPHCAPTTASAVIVRLPKPAGWFASCLLLLAHVRIAVSPPTLGGAVPALADDGGRWVVGDLEPGDPLGPAPLGELLGLLEFENLVDPRAQALGPGGASLGHGR